MNRISKFTENTINQRYGKPSFRINEGLIMKKSEAKKLIHDIDALIDSWDDEKEIEISKEVVDALTTTINYLKDNDCHISDEYNVRIDGIVQDGVGYIYAGIASKLYKVGDKLSRKENDEILEAIEHSWCNNYPFIMLSRINKNHPTYERYMYFTLDEHKRYYCFKTSTNQDAELGLTFKNYIYHRLPDPVRFSQSSDYAFRRNTKGFKTSLNAFPMGSVIKMDNTLYVKVSPVGTSTCRELFNGAIDI